MSVEDMSPELIERIAVRALVHGDRERNEETLLAQWDELFPKSKDAVRKMVRDVLWAIQDAGLVITAPVAEEGT